MSRLPWSQITRDAYRWRNESAEQTNRRTLERLIATEGNERLLKDVTDLNIIEARYPDRGIEFSEEGAAKIPCPICKSVKYLVPSFYHPRVLVCERPNCVYERASRKVARFKLHEVVNE